MSLTRNLESGLCRLEKLGAWSSSGFHRTNTGLLCWRPSKRIRKLWEGNRLKENKGSIDDIILLIKMAHKQWFRNMSTWTRIDEFQLNRQWKWNLITNLPVLSPQWKEHRHHQLAHLIRKLNIFPSIICLLKKLPFCDPFMIIFTVFSLVSRVSITAVN